MYGSARYTDIKQVTGITKSCLLPQKLNLKTKFIDFLRCINVKNRFEMARQSLLHFKARIETSF